MSSSGPTKNQISFIMKLRDSSPERNEKAQAILRSAGKGRVEELSVQDASKLIDELKKIKVENEKSSTHLTGKQLSFLQTLTRDENRKVESDKYLKMHRKEDLNFLSIEEASELIELLKDVKGEVSGNISDKPASPKQVKFIKGLQETEDSMEISRDYLADIRKKSLDELTSREASVLIEKLKIGKH